MGEPFEQEKQARLRDDWWLFVKTVGKHGHALITLISGCGLLWVLEKIGLSIPPWTVPWVVALSVVIGAFISWRTERDAREKAQVDLRTMIDAKNAIPNFAGIWFTKFGGSVTVSQQGRMVSSKFPHGSVDHFSEGQYDPLTKKIAMTTVRVDAALPVETQRYVYPETWEYLDENRILFDCPRNFLGDHEYGILTRRK